MRLCGKPIGEQMPIRSVGTLHTAGAQVNGAKDPAMGCSNPLVRATSAKARSCALD
jgi:hypothetical protein